MPMQASKRAKSSNLKQSGLPDNDNVDDDAEDAEDADDNSETTQFDIQQKFSVSQKCVHICTYVCVNVCMHEKYLRETAADDMLECCVAFAVYSVGFALK